MHKVTWFVLHKTWHTTLFDIYYCVEVVQIVNNSHMLEITCLVAILGFLSVFGTFVHNVAQTWFVLHENWHTTLFRIYYVVEVVRMENDSHMLEITC